MRILLLGGSGTAGSLIARLLLHQSDAAVILAGRRPAALQAAAERLRMEWPAGRVETRVADAADGRSLRAALEGADLLAVASSSLPYVHEVAWAALEAGVDYYDLQLSSPAKHAVLRRLEPVIAERGRCFITDGGIHPGLSAVLVRSVAPQFDRLASAQLGLMMRADWNAYDVSPDTIRELTDEMRDYGTGALQGGVWRRLGWNEMQRRLDFGPPFGAVQCSVMELEELRLLAASMPGLRDCGFFVSGFNWFTDYALLPLGWVALKAAPRTASKPFGAAMAWSLRRFSRPPYATILQLEAEGDAEGRPLRVLRRTSHADGYHLTAAAAVACLLQYLDGTIRRPGLWWQALAVEPDRFLAALESMDVRVTTETP